VHRPLFKTQSNEAMQAILGGMIDGENCSPQTASAIHQETWPAIRREIHRKRDRRESCAVAVGQPPVATNNRTDVLLDLNRTHLQCPVLGAPPIADPHLAEVDEDEHVFLHRGLGSLEEPGDTTMGPIVFTVPAPPIVARAPVVRGADTSSVGEDTVLDERLDKRTRIDVPESIPMMALLPAASVPAGYRLEKYPCTCTSGGKLQPGLSKSGVGRRAHKWGCPRHSKSPSTLPVQPVDGVKLQVTFETSNWKFLVYNRKWAWSLA